MARFCRLEAWVTRGKICDWCFKPIDRYPFPKGLELDGQIDWCFCRDCVVKFKSGDVSNTEADQGIYEAYLYAVNEGWQ